MKFRKTLICLLCVIMCAAIFAVGLTACSNHNFNTASLEAATVTLDGKTYTVASVEDPNSPTLYVNSSLELRDDMFISSTYARCAHYVNCRFNDVYMRPSDKVDENGYPLDVPYFDDCVFFGASFEKLPADAEIVVNGATVFANCTFLPSQKLIINADCTFTNCTGVSLYPADGNTYKLEVVGTSISFNNTSNVEYDIRMTGGSVVLPDANLITNFKLLANGAEITIPNSQGLYNSVEAIGCVVNAIDNIMFRKIEASSIYFGNSENRTAKLRFGIYIGNEIYTEDYKDTIIFGGMICTNNYVNGVNSAHNSFVEMKRGTSDIDKCSVCSGNFNGAVVL